MNPKIEMRIYEILGVTIFRKLVFMLEKFIHRKDHGSNINYHIPSKGAGALDAFIKYLFYNGSIHVRNLAIFAGYILLKLIFQWRFRFYDGIFTVLAVKDLYCVMLQRYNFLRIKEFQIRLAQKQMQRKRRAIEQTRESFTTAYDFSFAEEDLALVRKIKDCIQNRRSIILSDADIAGLERLLQATDRND